MLTGVPDTAKEARRGIMETISLDQGRGYAQSKILERTSTYCAFAFPTSCTSSIITRAHLLKTSAKAQNHQE